MCRWGMVSAAQGGHKGLVILFKEWGATNYSRGMAMAGSGCYEDIILLFEEWITNAKNYG